MGCSTLPRSRLDSRAGRPVWSYVAVGGRENGVEVSEDSGYAFLAGLIVGAVLVLIAILIGGLG